MILHRQGQLTDSSADSMDVAVKFAVHVAVDVATEVVVKFTDGVAVNFAVDALAGRKRPYPDARQDLPESTVAQLTEQPT